MINQQERKHILIFSLVWLVLQLLLLWHNGIFADGESIKYIDQAQKFLQNGKFTSNNFIFYSTQILLIAAVLKIKAGFWLIILIQFVFSWWATFSLYKLAHYLFNSLTALIAVILFLLNLPLQEFNTFLQTESLFYSITIITSSYVIRLQQFKLKHFLIIFPLLILISVTRPTGLLFIPVVFLYLFFYHFNFITIVQKITLALILGFTFFFVLNWALGSGGELDFILPFIKENIICGVPSFSDLRDAKSLGYENSLYGLLSYIFHHFQQFIKLSWLRSIAFWGLLRTYYGMAHNIYLAMLFYPIYILCIFHLIFSDKKSRPALTYCAILILLTWITVLITCDDWHNRFFLTISPYLILFASPVLANLISRISNNKISQTL